MSPEISIALPCYNQEDYIQEAIESILDQDYKNVKIVISDDASTDQTPEIIKTYQKKYPQQIFSQFHKQNLGVTANVRSIFPLLTGKYLCWFAGDDIFLPNKLSKQVNLMEANPDVVLSYHNVEIFNSDTKSTMGLYNGVYGGHKPYEGYIVPELLMYRCFIPALSTMIRREFTKDIMHSNAIQACSDWLYFIEVSERGKVCYIDEVLGKYRRHGSNISDNLNYISEEEKVYEEVLSIYPKYEKYIDKGKATLYFTNAAKLLKKHHISESLEQIKKFLSHIRKKPKTLTFFSLTILQVLYRISLRFIKRISRI